MAEQAWNADINCTKLPRNPLLIKENQRQQERAHTADTVQVDSKPTMVNGPLQAQRPATTALRAGKSWRYERGFLINEFVGRHGHTPAWIVEVEGTSFKSPVPHSMLHRMLAAIRSPRIVRRNKRRLSFAWPLKWPPPDETGRMELVCEALHRARAMGGPLPPGCGVCGNTWEGGPTFVRGRARHLCADCADHIAETQEYAPPGPLATWMWCLVAGVAGLLLQMLFHWSWGWSVVPLALVAGWLMGSANAPNLERQPVVNGLLMLLLVFILQTLGWTLHTAAQIGYQEWSDLTRIFVLTALSLPTKLVLGFLAGSAGLGMSVLEKRLRKA